MSHKNLEFLNKRRIIYRRSPISDIPSESFDWGDYYEDGTYECYDLFRSKAKITTYKSLKWHLIVLWYINPQMDHDDFNDIASMICNKANGFVIFDMIPSHYEKMIYDVLLYDLETPPNNKMRKIIFKEYSGLTPKEKMSVVGRLVGKSKSIIEDDIYQCMLDIHDEGNKITINALASLLNCSSRTVHRAMSNQLKKEKELLNQQL
tara:strand:+ start:1446 stop:2063 length:618 start_codon:yes stop_codon:yes gene_type:complete